MLTHLQLMNPLLDALRDLGGSAHIDELAQQVVKSMALPPEIAELPHGKGPQTEIEYRLAWARNYLKNAGFVENPSRQVWAFTPAGRDAGEVDPKEIARTVRAKFQRRKEQPAEESRDGQEEEAADGWRVRFLEALMRMEPQAFERLCQRLLRESGFLEVEVTGRSGDGGIDGRGIIQLAGLISFNVIFQAKRYRQNVSSGIVRDFRGAMQGRADKGLIITTAGFTRDAREEATRDGAPPIDLISGEDLVELLKQRGIGVTVTTRTVEDVVVEEGWLRNL